MVDKTQNIVRLLIRLVGEYYTQKENITISKTNISFNFQRAWYLLPLQTFFHPFSHFPYYRELTLKIVVKLSKSMRKTPTTDVQGVRQRQRKSSAALVGA